MEKASLTSTSYSDIRYPSLVKRIQALFIDFVLILIIFALSSLIIGLIGDTATGVKVGILIFCVIIYEPLLVTFTGGTLGHKAVGIQVKSYAQPDQNIPVFSAIVRIVVKGLLGWISFLSVSFNSEKRAIHDMVSGSIVRMR